MLTGNFLSILQTLVKNQVDFIVVGGIAAGLRGAPVLTLDLDVVHSTDPANVARILAVLEELDARYRHHPARLRPNASHLESPGHQLLITRFGPFDLLGNIGRGRSYSDLLPLTLEMDVRGVRIRVLTLEAQIAVKEEVGGEKDAAMLPLLRKTLQESRRENTQND
jgi:hypothetical protein